MPKFQNDKNINVLLEVEQQGQKFDLTDSLESISIRYGIDDIFPEVELKFSINSSIFKKANIGNYTETYILTIHFPNLTDRPRSYTLTLSPFEYVNLNMVNIGDSTTLSESMKNSKEVPMHLKCMYANIQNIGHAESKIWRNKKLSEILKDLAEFVTDKFFLDEPEYDMEFKQFFLPFQKMYYAFPFVLSYGTYSSNLYTMFVSWKGLHVVRLEKAKDRKTIEVVIYDKDKYSKSTKYSLHDVSLVHSPVLKFQTGGTFRMIHPSTRHSKIKNANYLMAYLNPDFDFPGIYDGQQSKPYIVTDLRKMYTIDSIIETKDRAHLLDITISNPIELEATWPLYYEFDVKFRDQFLRKYSKKYYTINSEMTISRTEQAYRMRTNLTMIPDLKSDMIET